MEVPTFRVSGCDPLQWSYNSHDVPRAWRYIFGGRDVRRRGLWFATVLVVLDRRRAEDGVVHDRRSLAGDHLHGNPRHGYD